MQYESFHVTLAGCDEKYINSLRNMVKAPFQRALQAMITQFASDAQVPQAQPPKPYRVLDILVLRDLPRVLRQDQEGRAGFCKLIVKLRAVLCCAVLAVRGNPHDAPAPRYCAGFEDKRAAGLLHLMVIRWVAAGIDLQTGSTITSCAAVTYATIQQATRARGRAA